MAQRISGADSAPSLFGLSPAGLRIFLVVTALVGIAIRLIDLTDPPLDFNPSRQLRAAVIARGIYYQLDSSADPLDRDVAVRLRGTIGDFEPSILEGIVGLTYLLAGQELLWISRLYTAAAWLLGGLALFALARRAVSAEAALLVLGFYLFLPFSVHASRSFQPDPLMVMWTVFSMYSAYRWGEEQALPSAASWRWVLLTGVLGGMAALTKVVAAYLIGGMLVALVLYRFGFRRALKNLQVWVVAAIVLLPSIVYYVFVLGDGASGYFQNWVLALAPQLLTFDFYLRWAGRVHSLINAVFILAALAGVWLAKRSYRVMLLGLWVGYILYGLSLPQQTMTHDYYHIQLVPIVALSLAPVVAWLIDRIAPLGLRWRAAFAGVFLAIAFVFLRTARGELLTVDYRNDPPYWEAIGDAVPRNGRFIALTQGYGFPLTYYGWKKVNLWPVSQELKLSLLRGTRTAEFDEFFAQKTAGHDYFLVTAFQQLDRQPLLKETLYADYLLVEETPAYLLFDLRLSTSETQ